MSPALPQRSAPTAELAALVFYAQMKYTFYTFLTLFLGLLNQADAVEQSVLARITVYWRGESGQRASWNGASLRTGHCAVDPKKIPYGSKVIFPDAACTAVDTGSAVVSRKAARLTGRTAAQKAALVIDRYFDSKSEALSWSRNHPSFMTVQIEPPGARRKAQTFQASAQADVLPLLATLAAAD